jgi:hypothetical protein
MRIILICKELEPQLNTTLFTGLERGRNFYPTQGPAARPPQSPKATAAVVIRRNVMTEEAQAEHTLAEHTHGGDDCAHEKVPHGDHVDYLHDGHRHAEHEDHYDEH